MGKVTVNGKENPGNWTGNAHAERQMKIDNRMGNIGISFH